MDEAEGTEGEGFQLPFRDSRPRRDEAHAFTFAFNSLFGILYGNEFHASVGVVLFQLPFRDSGVGREVVEELAVSFQLPFRDSAPEQPCLPRWRRTFNSLFGIPIQPEADVIPVEPFNSLFGILLSRSYLSRFQFELSTPFSGFSSPSSSGPTGIRSFNSLFGIPRAKGERGG